MSDGNWFHAAGVCDSALLKFVHRYAVTKSDWKLSPTQCERYNYGKRVSCGAKFYATANLTAAQLLKPHSVESGAKALNVARKGCLFSNLLFHSAYSESVNSLVGRRVK